MPPLPRDYRKLDEIQEILDHAKQGGLDSSEMQDLIERVQGLIASFKTLDYTMVEHRKYLAIIWKFLDEEAIKTEGYKITYASKSVAFIKDMIEKASHELACIGIL